MNRVLQLCVVICLPLLVSAQAYIPVLNENATWDVFLSAPVMCGFDDGGQYFVDNDTTIQGEDFKIVRRYHIDHSGPFFCPPYAVDMSVIDANREHYLREDTATRKVYFFDTATGNTDLLYDFTLQVGDTINSDYLQFYPPSERVINFIDTVTLLNGQQRRRFHLGNASKFYVEGIGGSTGIGNFLVAGFGVDLLLTCFREFNVPLLDPMDVQQSMCVIALGQARPEAPAQISVLPNPSNGRVIVRASSPYQRTFQLFDLSGRSVFSRHLSNADETVHLDHIRPGVYLYGLNGHPRQRLILSD